MSIILKNGNETLALPASLLWTDEADWHPVEQTVQRTITGALIVSVGQRVAGRPITLEPADDQSAWMSRAMLDTLRNWASVPGRVLTLTLRGQARQVIFRHHETAIDAKPIVHYEDVVASDFYATTLRMMEI